jgi:hypothetical protein
MTLKNLHGTPRAEEIAVLNTILRTQVGSGLHGCGIDGQDDRDEMGVCIEPPCCVIGLESFEQYQFRTQPEGKRSGPGDLDLVIYSLRKWARLAANGNPSVLLLLYAPRSEWVRWDDVYGPELQARTDLFLSREAGRRFIGYLRAQREQMLGLRSKHTNRPELIDVYGFDTKFAYHAVRLGIQGVELLTTGNISLPIPEPERTWLRELRVGKHTKQEALDRIDDLESKLVTLSNTVDLPENTDTGNLNKWLSEVYLDWWEKSGLLTYHSDQDTVLFTTKVNE